MNASWIDVAADSDFPLDNLPYGAFCREGAAQPHIGVALGDVVVDLHILARAGLFDGALPDAREMLCAANLNVLLARGRVCVAERTRARDRTAHGDIYGGS